MAAGLCREPQLPLVPIQLVRGQPHRQLEEPLLAKLALELPEGAWTEPLSLAHQPAFAVMHQHEGLPVRQCDALYDVVADCIGAEKQPFPAGLCSARARIQRTVARLVSGERGRWRLGGPRDG